MASHNTESKEKKKKYKKMTLSQKVIAGVAIACAAFMVGAMGYHALMNWKPLIGNEGTVENKLEFSNVDSEYDDDDLDIDQIVENQVNILCLGMDEEEGHTDVMMLVSLDVKEQRIKILQIPRDSYVGVGSTGKINAAYLEGNQELSPINRVVEIINDQFYLPVDHYVMIGCQDLVNIIDAIGGIKIDVPERIVYEADKIIEAGPQTLNGQQAEWFVRFRREYVEGDTGRMKVQRLFLAACMEKAKNMGIKEIVNVLPTVMKSVRTDLSVNDITELANFCLGVDLAQTKVFMIPGEGYMYGDQAVWSIHRDSTADMLNKYFRPYQREVPAIIMPIEELVNTGEWYENTEDDFQSLINGATPGQKKEEITETTETTQ